MPDSNRARNCILTTKDLSILEVMLDRRQDRPDNLVTLLRDKIDNATIMLRQDVPPRVATMNSRVEFSVAGGAADMRVITQDRMTSPIGRFLPVTTPRGLALLGLSEGQSTIIPTHDGGTEEIRLLRVLHQPENAQRLMRPRMSDYGVKPKLTLLQGGKAEPAAAHAGTPSGGYPDDDGNGPSAA